MCIQIDREQKKEPYIKIKKEMKRIVRESHRNEIIGFDFVAVDDVVLVSQKSAKKNYSTNTHALSFTYSHIFTIVGNIQFAVVNTWCDVLKHPQRMMAHDEYNSIANRHWYTFASACDSFYCFE